MTSLYLSASCSLTPFSGSPKWQKVRVEATRSGVGPNNGPLTASQEGWMFFPQQSETLTYDNDGNLTSDARWTYAWDAENRLKSMEEKVIAGEGPARTRLEFTYDSQHRRVRKVVKSFSATTNSFVLSKDRRFIYDGWNLVAELDASPLQPGGSATSLELLRSYAWGNDLSGTAQGAGGVGGLLMIQERDLRAKRGGLTAQAPAVYAPIYDFNGNVINYVEINRGEGLTHTFDYDAFGRELTQDTLIPSGDTSPPESLPIKFSTKYHDEETGLAYYGYRYYNPEMGRWVNRDPIGERGGINLYGMVGNDAVNRWDYLGLEIDSSTFPSYDHFSRRFPNLIEGAKSVYISDINNYIEAAIRGNCEAGPSTYSGPSRRFAINAPLESRKPDKLFPSEKHPGTGDTTQWINDSQFGDPTQTWSEATFGHGQFVIDIETPVKITKYCYGGSCSYDWTAKMYVEDNSGEWRIGIPETRRRYETHTISGGTACCNE